MSGPWEDYAPAQADGPWADYTPAPKSKPKRKRSLMDDAYGAAVTFNRNFVPFADEASDAIQAGVNVFSGKAKSLGEGWRQARGQAGEAEASFAQDRPKVAALTRGVGNAATVAVPAGNTANLFAQGVRGANLATASNAARGATLAAGQAALYAAGDRGSARERLSAASRAARDPVTIGLGAVSGVIATPKGARKVRQPKVDADTALLHSEGVQLTQGQMGGRVARTAEDAATSLPFVGDAIAERRTEGLHTFNRAVVNRALKPVGMSLPKDIPPGADAVKWAGDRLSKGYETAIPGRVIRADPGFADDARAALANIGTLTPDAQAKLADILDQRVTSRLPETGAMDGQLYKTIQSELDYEVSRFSKATDPDQRAIGDAIEGIQSALEKAARRQDPQFAAKIDALDRGWAELGRIEVAAAKSPDLSGVFTPAQYAGSIRAADTRVRRRGVARGEALSQDLARAGVRKLPSKMPDSGTAGRAAWGMVASAPGAVLGAVTGGGVGALAGIGGTAATLGALSRRYTPEAVEAANIALTARLAQPERDRALAALEKMAASDPRVRELYAQVAARLSRAAGVSGGARASQPANLFAQP